MLTNYNLECVSRKINYLIYNTLTGTLQSQKCVSIHRMFGSNCIGPNLFPRQK